jgi:hypothetical protein
MQRVVAAVWYHLIMDWQRYWPLNEIFAAGGTP